MTAPKLTPAQKKTLIALVNGTLPKPDGVGYRPIAKLMEAGLAERKFKHPAGPYSMSVHYAATPAGVERARELEASKKAAPSPQIP